MLAKISTNIAVITININELELLNKYKILND